MEIRPLFLAILFPFQGYVNYSITLILSLPSVLNLNPDLLRCSAWNKYIFYDRLLLGNGIHTNVQQPTHSSPFQQISNVFSLNYTTQFTK